MRSFATIFGFCVLLGGCSVATVQDEGGQPSENTCQSHDECGSGFCDPSRNICVAEGGEIGTLLVQIIAPSDSGSYSLLSFPQTADLPNGGGELDWMVPAPAELVAEVHPPPQPTGSTCVNAYGASGSETVPVSVRFRPTEQVFGLAAQDVKAESAPDANTGIYGFKARMAPGHYDVYVEPEASALQQDACVVVPQVFRDFEVAAGKASEPLKLYLEPPSTLEVIVDWPDTAANTGKQLDGWSVDIVDPATGWVLSRKATLAFSEYLVEQKVSRYTANVAYSRLHDPELDGTELVRVSPPIDPNTQKPVIAPTFVLERKAVELLVEGEAQINHITSLPEPVAVDGYLFDSADVAVAKDIDTDMSLRFVSKKLYLEDSSITTPALGDPVYFSIETVTSAGRFDVQLLPGEYDVYAIPVSAESNVAVTRSSLTVKVGQNPQSGKSIVIDTTTQLQGLALGPNGDPVVGAKVRASASPAGADPVWNALGLKAPKPLSADGIVGKDGSFTVPVHPGALDVSIRPADATGFAWLVRPNVAVSNGIHDLGTMSLPLPVVYDGTVWVDADTTLPNALIQAYVFLNPQGYTDDRAVAKSVVQVAETRADGAGKFQLLLPAHLN